MRISCGRKLWSAAARSIGEERRRKHVLMKQNATAAANPAVERTERKRRRTVSAARVPEAPCRGMPREGITRTARRDGNRELNSSAIIQKERRNVRTENARTVLRSSGSSGSGLWCLLQSWCGPGRRCLHSASFRESGWPEFLPLSLLSASCFLFRCFSGHLNVPGG